MSEGELGRVFARNLKVLRERRGLSQGTLARRAGVCRPTVVALENRQMEPSIRTLGRLSEALEVPAWTLLCEGEVRWRMDGRARDEFLDEIGRLLDGLEKEGR